MEHNRIFAVTHGLLPCRGSTPFCLPIYLHFFPIFIFIYFSLSGPSSRFFLFTFHNSAQRLVLVSRAGPAVIKNFAHCHKATWRHDSRLFILAWCQIYLSTSPSLLARQLCFSHTWENRTRGRWCVHVITECVCCPCYFFFYLYQSVAFFHICIFVQTHAAHYCSFVNVFCIKYIPVLTVYVVRGSGSAAQSKVASARLDTSTEEKRKKRKEVEECSPIHD